MQNRYFLLFFWVFLLFYTVINGYIYVHGYRMAPIFWVDRTLFSCIFIFFSSAYIVGEILQRKYSSIATDILITLGSLWFVGIVHFFCVSVLYDMFRVVNCFLHFARAETITVVAYHTTWITVVTTLMTLIFGYLNARNPMIREHTVTLHKKNGKDREIIIAVATDIHLGPINGVSHVDRVVRKINALNPDIILLPWDILDGDLDPVIRRDLGSHLTRLTSRYGTYGITGNHEYIGGVDHAVDYISRHGVRLLRDEAVQVGGIVLVGRDDYSAARYDHTRKSLKEILQNDDSSRPIILMDHQPKQLSESVENGIDIQFSGHTHNGQLFPVNLIVRRVFEVARGYLKKGNTHIFVSSGVGTWWPPVRTSGRPEILCVRVKFVG